VPHDKDIVGGAALPSLVRWLMDMLAMESAGHAAVAIGNRGVGDSTGSFLQYGDPMGPLTPTGTVIFNRFDHKLVIDTILLDIRAANLILMLLFTFMLIFASVFSNWLH
jgi:hypothetical protein